jgi:hypothetical protein
LACGANNLLPGLAQGPVVECSRMPLIDLTGVSVPYADGSVGVIKQEEPCRIRKVQLGPSETSHTIPFSIERPRRPPHNVILRIANDVVASWLAASGTNDDDDASAAAAATLRSYLALSPLKGDEGQLFLT